MNPKFQRLYIDIATRVAEMSTAVRLKVGCIIVKDDKIISLGYNGTPSGWDNECETKEWWGLSSASEDEFPYVGEYIDTDGIVVECCYQLKTKPEVLHAEMNALMKLAKSTQSGEGAVAIVTHSPCLECSKGMYQAGIKEVFYREDYRTNDGIDFLKKCGIKVEKVIR